MSERARPVEPLYAHTPRAGTQHWDTLEMHLVQTAERGRRYADAFGAGPEAWWAGLLHDIGKAHPDFQRYLRAAAEGRRAPRCPHAAWGAALALLLFKGTPHRVASLALPVDGHHRGLMDWDLVAQDLDGILRDPAKRALLDGMARHLPRPPEAAGWLAKLQASPRGSPDLRTRMIHSALIDADRVETAIHFGGFEEPVHASVEELWRRLEARQVSDHGGAAGWVNEARAAIYRDAVRAAEGAPGFYSLTAPTGSGKTRTAMAFALRHAAMHGLRRVVVAIPYTSIIEQNAKAYRELLGEADVLEHHSQVEPEEPEEPDEAQERARLATERWSHPVVVTTNVQLFEALFSHRPARTRRLHHLARSVIVLDEFQAFPVELLVPTMDVLRDLVANYGVTVVFSTATQPALHLLPGPVRVESREIVEDPARWFQALRRVRYEYRPDPVAWDDLARELAAVPQALVVLNTRRHARTLLERLQAQGAGDRFHLSTLMCGAHRRDVLARVRQRLLDRKPVRLVSTQVVEAGVDLDFPTAYRAIGPLDRILQVAGRCNREGKRQEKGHMVVFRPEDGASPRGPYRAGLGLAQKLLEEQGPAAVEEPQHLEAYFRDLWEVAQHDPFGIQELRDSLQFERVGQTYRLIDEATVPAVVAYEPPRKEGTGTTPPDPGGPHGLARSFAREPSRKAWQRLQPFVVNLYRKDAATAQREGWLTPVTPGLNLWTGKYDDLLGVTEGLHDPADLVR